MSYIQILDRVCEVCAGIVLAVFFFMAIWSLPQLFLFFAELLEQT